MWIFLRGLTRESRHWGEFLPQFAKQHDKEKVMALDLPGNGEFADLRSPASVRGMLTFARQQLLTQGLQPPYRLLAMSLGGMVAVDWAQQHPDDIAGLVLINTSMRPFGNLTQRLRPASWWPMALLAAHWRNATYAEQTERSIHRLTCKLSLPRHDDVAAWLRIRRSAPVSATNAVRQLWAAARFCSAAAPPGCPTLLLSSAADQLVDPACSWQLAAAWQTPHQQHRWAGHDLPHDDGPWVCRQVADWLETIVSR